VVNLDGLVNNDVFEYVAENWLPDYLSVASVHYVVDFEQMLLSESFRRRGGYNIASFVECLEPLKGFGDRDQSWGQLMLYRVGSVPCVPW